MAGETPWTAGPWKVKWIGGGSYEIAAIVRADWQNSALNPNYWGSGMPGLARQPSIEERKANAALIAAAPELYRALTELLEANEISERDMERHEYESIVDEADRQARKALAKARGDQP